MDINKFDDNNLTKKFTWLQINESDDQTDKKRKINSINAIVNLIREYKQTMKLVNNNVLVAETYNVRYNDLINALQKKPKEYCLNIIPNEDNTIIVETNIYDAPVAVPVAVPVDTQPCELKIQLEAISNYSKIALERITNFVKLTLSIHNVAVIETKTSEIVNFCKYYNTSTDPDQSDIDNNYTESVVSWGKSPQSSLLSQKHRDIANIAPLYERKNLQSFVDSEREKQQQKQQKQTEREKQQQTEREKETDEEYKKRIDKGKTKLLVLMTDVENFSNVLLTFLTTVFADIKYVIKDNMYVFLYTVSSDNFQNQHIPKQWLNSLPDCISHVCQSRLYIYKHMFTINRYTQLFKRLICKHTDVFVDFITKLNLSGAVQVISGNTYIYDIEKLQKEGIHTLLEYSNIIYHTRLNFSKLITVHASSDLTYMSELYTKVKSLDPVIKGGNLYYLYMKQFQEKNNSEFTEINLKLGDWDLVTNNPDNEVYGILRYLQDDKLLIDRYTNVFEYIQTHINKCDIDNISISKKQQSDMKMFYVKDYPKIDYNNFTKHNVIPLSELGDYHSFILFNTIKKTYFPIIDIEVYFIHNDSPEKYEGFELIRMASKFKIILSVNSNYCVMINPYCEILDFGKHKKGGKIPFFTLQLRSDEIYNIVKYNNIEFKVYSIQWFQLDLVDMFYKSDQKDITKQCLRGLHLLKIFKHTDVTKFNEFIQRSINMIPPNDVKKISDCLLELYTEYNYQDKFNAIVSI